MALLPEQFPGLLVPALRRDGQHGTALGAPFFVDAVQKQPPQAVLRLQAAMARGRAVASGRRQPLALRLGAVAFFDQARDHRGLVRPFRGIIRCRGVHRPRQSQPDGNKNRPCQGCNGFHHLHAFFLPRLKPCACRLNAKEANSLIHRVEPAMATQLS